MIIWSKRGYTAELNSENRLDLPSYFYEIKNYI